MKKGFTLIELLISMVIFVVFLGLVSTSYVSIVRAQKNANQVRKIYSEVRTFVEMVTEEVRLSAIDYECYEGGFGGATQCADDLLEPDGRSTILALVRKGGQEKTVFKYVKDGEERGTVLVEKSVRIGDTWGPAPGYENGFKNLLSDNLDVDHLSFAVYPNVNPYTTENYIKTEKQFQPKVTLFMSVSDAVRADSKFELNFQTTISSRVYSRAI